MTSFETLYTANAARVLAVITKILRSSRVIVDPVSSAEDVSQLVWTRCHCHLEAGEVLSAPWLFTAAKHAALNCIRDAGPQTLSLSAPLAGGASGESRCLGDTIPSRSTAVASDPRLGLILDAMQELPDTLRVPMHMLVDGASSEDICLSLRISPATLRQRLSRARTAITSALQIKAA